MKHVRRRGALTIVAVVALVGVASVALARVAGARADCPGKIVCPRTGELICRDKCPTVDDSRLDCPGRVVCPLTGKLVCKDRCPADQNNASTDAALPPCCQKKN